MVMTTGAHPKDLWPGVAAHFGHKYDEHNMEYMQCFDQEGSDKAYEERVKLSGFGLAPTKTQGASITFDDAQQEYVSRITNITYGIGGIITREAIEDGQYESLSTRVAGYIAFSIRQTLENVAANVLNRAFNSSYVGGDGTELLATDHPVTVGTFSNELATPADLSEAALEDLLIQIMQASNSRGLKISLTGKKLIVPPPLVFEAQRITESSLRSGTANNDLNALKDMGMLPDGVVTNHYLTDPDAWFIKTNCPEGLICQNRRNAEFGQDNDFDTENAKMKGTVRKGFGWGDPLGLFGSAGA
jgi:phage major head subunit gpT-like protein